MFVCWIFKHIIQTLLPLNKTEPPLFLHIPSFHSSLFVCLFVSFFLDNNQKFHLWTRLSPHFSFMPPLLSSLVTSGSRVSTRWRTLKIKFFSKSESYSQNRRSFPLIIREQKSWIFRQRFDSLFIFMHKWCNHISWTKYQRNKQAIKQEQNIKQTNKQGSKI